MTHTANRMNNTFWIGVYPGLSCEMLAYVVEQFNAFFKKVRL